MVVINHSSCHMLSHCGHVQIDMVDKRTSCSHILKYCGHVQHRCVGPMDKSFWLRTWPYRITVGHILVVQFSSVSMYIHTRRNRGFGSLYPSLQFESSQNFGIDARTQLCELVHVCLIAKNQILPNLRWNALNCRQQNGQNKSKFLYTGTGNVCDGSRFVSIRVEFDLPPLDVTSFVYQNFVF